MQNLNKAKIKEKVKILSEKGMLADSIEDAQVVVNLCNEERWFVKDSEDTPEELRSKKITSSIQSLARIDSLINEIDKHFVPEHKWSNLLTYVDLIKSPQENVEIRLRYELHRRGQRFLKWIYVEKVDGDDIVFVQMADTPQEIESFENKFLGLKFKLSKISLKHLKYFLLGRDMKQIEDYLYTEFEGSRFGIRLGKGNFYKSIPFVGLYVQDRFSMDVVNSEHDSQGTQSVMHLINSRLSNTLDKMSLVKDLNLINHGLRVELETQYEEGLFSRNQRITEMSDKIKEILDKNDLSRVLNKK